MFNIGFYKGDFMILTIFITILALSLVLLFVGKVTDAPPVQIVGYLFLFLLGITLMLGGVSYKSGETYSYVCACCDTGGYYNPTCAGGNLTLSSTTDVYTNYSGEIISGIELHHVLGFFMVILSVLGFVIVMFNLKDGIEGGDFNY